MTATAMQLARLRRIRWAVRLTLLAGVAASVAANVLHARQNPISQTIAAWPPLALLLNVELISRVPVHRRSLAVVRLLATSAIAGIAAWVSYWHMAGVASYYGEHGASAYLLPFSVDGLIVVASISLVELAGHIRTLESTAQPLTIPSGLANAAPVRIARDEPVPAEDDTVLTGQPTQDETVSAEDMSEPTPDLINRARDAARTHRQATGKDITRDELRAALRIATGAASELLRRLRDETRTTPLPPAPIRAGVIPVAADAFTRANHKPTPGMETA